MSEQEYHELLYSGYMIAVHRTLKPSLARQMLIRLKTAIAEPESSEADEYYCGLCGAMVPTSTFPHPHG